MSIFMKQYESYKHFSQVQRDYYLGIQKESTNILLTCILIIILSVIPASIEGMTKPNLIFIAFGCISDLILLFLMLYQEYITFKTFKNEVNK